MGRPPDAFLRGPAEVCDVKSDKDRTVSGGCSLTRESDAIANLSVAERLLHDGRTFNALLGSVIVILLCLDVVEVFELCCEDERDFSSDSVSSSSSSIRFSENSEDAIKPPL